MDRESGRRAKNLRVIGKRLRGLGDADIGVAVTEFFISGELPFGLFAIFDLPRVIDLGADGFDLFLKRGIERIEGVIELPRGSS